MTPQVYPVVPGKISIARVNEFIMFLSKRLHIGMVSMDQFQSSSSLQFFEENRIPCRYQSVDRTDKAYLFFVDCMYRKIVKFPSDFAEAIKHELFNLDWNRDKHKVDHPSDTAHGGMKDRMAAVVGALYNAYEIQTPSYNPQDLLTLAMHNPIEHISWRDDNPYGHPADPQKDIMPKEFVTSCADERELLSMSLTPTVKDDMTEVNRSLIDWDSVMHQDGSEE